MSTSDNDDDLEVTLEEIEAADRIRDRRIDEFIKRVRKDPRATLPLQRLTKEMARLHLTFWPKPTTKSEKEEYQAYLRRRIGDRLLFVCEILRLKFEPAYAVGQKSDMEDRRPLLRADRFRKIIARTAHVISKTNTTSIGNPSLVTRRRWQFKEMPSEYWMQAFSALPETLLAYLTFIDDQRKWRQRKTGPPRYAVDRRVEFFDYLRLLGLKPRPGEIGALLQVGCEVVLRPEWEPFLGMRPGVARSEVADEYWRKRKSEAKRRGMKPEDLDQHFSEDAIRKVLRQAKLQSAPKESRR